MRGSSILAAFALFAAAAAATPSAGACHTESRITLVFVFGTPVGLFFDNVNAKDPGCHHRAEFEADLESERIPFVGPGNYDSSGKYGLGDAGLFVGGQRLGTNLLPPTGCFAHTQPLPPVFTAQSLGTIFVSLCP